MRIDLGADHDEPEIGLIALIDCIFFLLMFFMVATTFKQQQGQQQARELPINLPTADVSLQANEAAPDPLVIGLDAQGRIYLDGAPSSVQQLHERLRLQAGVNAERPIRIDGDQGASYQQVVQVLDLCGFEGLRQVSLRVRQ
jgi:biopolymer transport protein ExbD